MNNPNLSLEQHIERWLISALTTSVQTVDINQPINLYGLDSLKMARVLGELMDWLGVTVPLNLFFEAKTLREVVPVLAQLVRSQQGEAALLQRATLATPAPLVRIQPKGAQPPLFVITASRNDLVPVKKITGSDVSNRPMIALLPPNTATTLADVVQAFAESIRSLQAIGHVFVLAYGAGLRVALPLMEQLGTYASLILLEPALELPSDLPTSAFAVNDPVLSLYRRLLAEESLSVYQGQVTLIQSHQPMPWLDNIVPNYQVAAALPGADQVGGLLNHLTATVPLPEYCPLAPEQRGLWFLCQMNPSSPFYHVIAGVRVQGSFDRKCLQAALDEVVHRHAILRTVFPVLDGKPVQRILAAGHLPLELVDLREQSSQAQQQHIRDLVRQPFDLTQLPLVRVYQCQLSEEEGIFVLCGHHLILDGASGEILLAEIFAHYQQRHLAPALGQYPHYVHWRLTQHEAVADAAYWREQLQSVVPLLDLVTDYPRPATQTFEGARLSFELSDLAGVRQLAQMERATPYLVLMTLFQILLLRLSGQQDFCIGTLFANRTQPAFADTLGMFVQTLPIRVGLSGELSFGEALRQVRETVFQAWQHHQYPLEQIIDDLELERSPAYAPLFQTLFVYQSQSPLSEGDALVITAEPVDAGFSQFDLTFNLTEHGDRLTGFIEYNTALFKEATIRRYLQCFKTILAAAITEPAQTIQQLPLLTPAEQQHILYTWNDTARIFPEPDFLRDILENTAVQYADEPAVIFEEQVLSYAELNRYANQLAQALHAQGVGRDTLVGVYMFRSLEMVIALLGITKAGAAYLPLDPTYPTERVRFMQEDARPALILTQQALAGDVENAMILDYAHWHLSDLPDALPPVTLSPTSSAYVIYTSGSTGQPKGVINTQRGIRNRLLWMQAEYQLPPGSRVLQKTPFSFDVSVWEFFWPLMAGATLVVARPEGHKDPAYLCQLIQTQQIEVLHFVPSMLRLFLEYTEAARCLSLRQVMCSGEALPASLQQRFFEVLPQVELHNLYGPTEAAVDVTAWACQPGDTALNVPIGKPIANTALYILDAQLAPVPVGVMGDLYIGGINLAQGYLNRPALTAERFIPNPFCPGETMYRTGDLAYYRADGVIEYMGRRDNQVKLNGNRIELGEVEAHLQAIPAVREACVLALDGRLHAFIVKAADWSTAHLQQVLQATLPAYMIPGVFHALDSLPLLPNGKVNRHQLQHLANTLHPANTAIAQVLPRSPLEVKLAEIWSQVLKVTPIGVHDNYFALGGDSMHIVEIVWQAQQQQLAVNVPDIYQYQTIAELAQAIAERQPITTTIPLHLADMLLPEKAEYAFKLSPMQHMVLHEYRSKPGSYHFQGAYRVEDASLSIAALITALERLAVQHPMLRATIDEKVGVQLIHPMLKATIQAADVSDCLLTEQEHLIADWLAMDRQHPFDTSNPDQALWRCQIFQLSPTTVELILVFHHSIIDGWSLVQLLNDLYSLYTACKQNKDVQLKPTAPVYREFVALERAAIQDTALQSFWQKTLKPAVFMPGPHHTPSQPQVHELVRTISPALTEKLLMQAEQAHLPLRTVCLSHYLDQLATLTGQNDLTVGVVANRRSSLLSNPLAAVGYFWNILPVQQQVIANKAEQLQRVHSHLQLLEGYALYPLPQILADLEVSEAFFAVFNFVNFHHQLTDLDVNITPTYSYDVFHYPLKLTVAFAQGKKQLALYMSYNPALFEARQVRQLATDMF